MKFFVASNVMTADESRDLAILQGCCGYYMNLPPVWHDQSITEGWTFPCVVTMTDDGLVASWSQVS